MLKREDCLIEVLTEELPPKSLEKLSLAFIAEVKERLNKAGLNYKDAKSFATPRRLAIIIKKCVNAQENAVIERKGPALEKAFDEKGNPTPACIGFARSCGVEPSQLATTKTPEGSWLTFKQEAKGKTIFELLPAIVTQSLLALPVPKRMRWGNGDVEFIRPIHSVILMFGKDIIPATILGIETGQRTRGHRYHSKNWLKISSPAQYEKMLLKNYVVADFDKRKEMIRMEATKLVHADSVSIDENLLDEVTGLVEWPVGVIGTFDSKFLKLPPELLISAMKDHQRYFPVLNVNKELQAQFVTISNIISKDPHHVIAGNERVLRARLSDAEFFYETDKKENLSSRVTQLKNIIFHAKLGTLFDKAERVAKLAKIIADKVGVNSTLASETAKLIKADLTTNMVSEFPELQGIAGFYYAKEEGKSDEIAVAIREHYLPRFSGDDIPHSYLGSVLAIADRLDTLVGVFGINQVPTGDKDPFGLRRAALGILRILIERKWDLDLLTLLQEAQNGYPTLENKNTIQVLNFILERLKPWCQDQAISSDVLASVSVLALAKPYDIHCRVLAVQAFKQFPEAESLSVANKRVSHILAKYESDIPKKSVDASLFEHNAEYALAQKLAEEREKVIALSQSANYLEALTRLAQLRQPVDEFFDHVLVMTEDKSRRENRLLMLKELRELFLHVADVALLQ